MAVTPRIEISTALLRTLHRIHGQRTDLVGQLQRGPRQIKAGDALVGQAIARVEQSKQLLKKAKMIADEKQLQLKSRESRIEDLNGKLNTASSNREFSTLKEQIAADQQANSVLSDEILEALEEMDAIAADVVAAVTEQKKQQAEHQQRVAEIQKSMVELKSELEQVEAALAKHEQQVPVAAMDDYRRLVEAKGEDALAPIDSESCGCCYQTLTTNVVDRLRMSLLVRCPNCNAFLYIPEDLTVR